MVGDQGEGSEGVEDDDGLRKAFTYLVVDGISEVKTNKSVRRFELP